MARTNRCLAAVAVLAATGCSQTAINQQPLMRDRPAGPGPAAGESLIFADLNAGDGAVEGRRDRDLNVRDGPQYYFGPGGRLYYPDGTPVPFESVKKQLQDLRTEQRIR